MEYSRLARDRQKWKTFVHEVISSTLGSDDEASKRYSVGMDFNIKISQRMRNWNVNIYVIKQQLK